MAKLYEICVIVLWQSELYILKATDVSFNLPQIRLLLCIHAEVKSFRFVYCGRHMTVIILFTLLKSFTELQPPEATYSDVTNSTILSS